MMFRLTTLLIAAALAVPAVAAARPGARDFQHTFPIASRLCERTDAGKLPKRLAGSADQIGAACDTLHSAYDAAVAAAQPGVDAYKQAVSDARSSVKAACGGDTADRQACRSARHDALKSVRSARQSFRDVRSAYRDAIRSARKAFWTTVKGLRGTASLTPDTSQGDDLQTT